MKLVIPWMFLVMLLSCGKNENITDELTASERAQIIARNRAKCISDNTSKFNNFKQGSRTVYTSSSWQRQDAWKVDYKQGTTSTITSIRIWKNTGGNLYLLYSKEDGSEGKYLRIPTATNDTVIADLLTNGCNGNATIKGTNPITMQWPKYQTNIIGGKRTWLDTYKFTITYPAIMGVIWNVNRSTTDQDAGGDDISGTNKTYTTTITELDSSAQTVLGTNYAVYGDQFCNIDTGTGIPYKLTCSSSLAGAGWAVNELDI